MATTYNIKVNDLIEALKEYEYVKIEFYKDGDFTIMSEAAFGYPNEAILAENYSIYDFKDCNNNAEWFTNWLEGQWIGGLPAYVNDELQNIHVNWLKE